MEIIKKGNSFSSRYLTELINQFRKEEGNTKELLHKNFLAKIEKEFEEEINQLNFQPVEYSDKKGELRKEYELNYEQSLQILMSESKTVRKKVIEVLKKLQDELNKTNGFNIPQTYKEALILAVNQLEIIENQNKLIEEQKHKVEFYDSVADKTGSFDFKEVSGLLKLPYGRNKLFSNLRFANVLMSDNLPYRRYLDEEYFTIVETSWLNNKTNEVNITKQTRVTQRGLEWLNKNKVKFNL